MWVGGVFVLVVLAGSACGASTSAKFTPYSAAAGAITEAAKRGGTHVLVAAERSSRHWKQVRQPRSTTKVVGGTVVSDSSPGDQLAVTSHSGAFIVVRVPPERWAELPETLQPAP